MSRPLRILIICAIVAAVVSANVVRRHQSMTGVDVHIEYNGCDTLETVEHIESLVLHSIPGFTSMRVMDVDLDKVISVVEESPYLVLVRASVSLGGRLVVHATQRRPLLRVYCGDECLYVDDEGVTMPLSPLGSSLVTVVSGHFRQKLVRGHGQIDLAAWQEDTVRSRYTLSQLWKVADFLQHRDDALKGYDQLYITEKGDFCLVPSWADFVVVLGDASRLEEKMVHLDRFVQRVMPIKGWDAYEEVSLKYKGQVVCRKRKESQ